jgi:hypothetical protein
MGFGPVRLTVVPDQIGLSVICVQKVPLREVSKIREITLISEVISLI